jgi:hypothetical protein
MVQKYSRSIFALLGTTVIMLGLLLQIGQSNQAFAAQITNRSLTLQAGTDGGSKPGGVVNHFFAFTIPSTGNVGSIQFQYCTLAAGACTTPTGLVTSSATYGSESGATGFSLVNTTNGAPYITRSASSISSGTPVSYQLLGVTNPTNTNCYGGTAPQSNNCTFYVRITTYATTNATGGVSDAGVVAASTATQISLTGQMPESLVFCTGGTVGTTVGVPDCGTATSGAVAFNQLFSPTDTATATSQMAASTNAGSGYAITVNGTTLSSGLNTITAMGTSTTGVRGIGQFGLNLKANTVATSTPAVGTEVAPAANGTNYKGQAVLNYNSVDNFKFVTGDTVANSSNGGAGGTDAQIFTVAYIVNVSGSQPAGTYTTTLTYICTPTF